MRAGAAEADDGAPWHDPAMPLADRMKLAEGKPLPRRMMAAMAQQDCGQCGYNCQDYADALFAKKEERLNLCVPGGKDTARMLKQLFEELRRGRRRAGGASKPAPAPRRARPFARQPGRRHVRLAPPAQQRRLAKGNLAHRIRSRRQRARLTTSATRFGIYPANDPALVDAVIAALARRRIFRSAGARCARC